MKHTNIKKDIRKQEYLMDLKNCFEVRGYTVQVNYQDMLGGDKIALTAEKDDELFQIRIQKSEKKVIGHYAIAVYATDRGILDDAIAVNENCKKKTSIANQEKRQFHNRLEKGIDGLSKNYNIYESQAGGHTLLEDKVKKLDAEVIGRDLYDVANKISPAIGVVFDEEGINSAFGVAVSGDNISALIPFDPIKNTLDRSQYNGYKPLKSQTSGKTGAGISVGGKTSSSGRNTSDTLYEGCDCAADIAWFAWLTDCHSPDLDGCDIVDCDFG